MLSLSTCGHVPSSRSNSSISRSRVFLVETHLGCNKLHFPKHTRESFLFYSQQLKDSRYYQSHLRLCSANGYTNASGLSDSRDEMPEQEGSVQKNESSNQGAMSSKTMLERLKRYGISGILSYGLLNTAYYLTTFLFVWFYVAPAPGKLGYLAAVERFLKVMAMVWAGSQVTKLVRAGGALALAPFVDRGLSWFTSKFKFQSKGKAFMAIAGFCFGLAIILFLVITLLWA